MNKETSYVLPVNEAGLPHSYCIYEREESPSMLIFDKYEMCKLYWKLERVKLEYRYVYNEVEYERNFELISLVNGRERMGEIPIFDYEGEWENGLYVRSWLGFEDIIRVKGMGGKYGLSFYLSEMDQQERFILATRKTVGYRTLDVKKINILGSRLDVYLQTSYKSSAGYIKDFTCNSYSST